MSLKDKKILIGITGSIAAYKIPVLVRLLIKEGAIPKIIMTEAARDFVTPLTLATLSKNAVLSNGFDPSSGSWNSHIELGSEADVYLIAPASANTLAKMAHGMADNLLTATYLAAKCPVFFAPAMDLDMYKHGVTQGNIGKLVSLGNHLIAPNEGELASGLCGAGRMEEPEMIVKILDEFFEQGKRFQKKKVLITAGPTYEAIDPVRFIGNRSSGKMGFALAQIFAQQGAEVTLICGPVSLETKESNIKRIDIHTADEMHHQCMKHAGNSDVIVMAAAVADYTSETIADRKIKKKSGELLLKLKKTKDILKELGQHKKSGQILVGFALETDNEIANAQLKVKEKNLDFIVLNSMNEKGAGFGYDTNKISILFSNLIAKNYSLKSKHEVAKDIVNEIYNCIDSKNSVTKFKISKRISRK